MGHSWLYVRGSPERQLSYLRMCHKPSKTSEEAQNVLSDTVKTLGKYLGIPTWISVCINPLNFVFHGLPPPVTHQDCKHHFNRWTAKLQQPTLVPEFRGGGIFPLHYLLYTFCFFLFLLSILIYTSFVFLFLIFLHKYYFYSFLFLQRLPIPLFHCKQIVLE